MSYTLSPLIFAAHSQSNKSLGVSCVLCSFSDSCYLSLLPVLSFFAWFICSVVLDHDNLSRAIEQTIERIEKSHLRGEDCAIYAELDRSHAVRSRPSKDSLERIPRVFPMSNELVAAGSSARGSAGEGKSRHFHPASEDPRQYTLLKV